MTPPLAVAMMGGMPAAVFALCAAPAATCAPLPSAATCTPQHVDLTDPAWDGLELDGNVDPERWLAERTWLWPLLQAATTALRVSVKAAYGIEATATLTVTQYPDDRVPEAVLTVAAPVVVGEDLLAADDLAFTFLWGAESGPGAAHVASAVSRMVAHARAAGVRRIGLPRIGCGYGGLDYRDVRPVLLAAADDLDLVVVERKR